MSTVRLTDDFRHHHKYMGIKNSFKTQTRFAGVVALTGTYLYITLYNLKKKKKEKKKREKQKRKKEKRESLHPYGITRLPLIQFVSIQESASHICAISQKN